MSGWGDLKKREMTLSYGSTDRILIKLDTCLCTHIYLTSVKPKECPSLSVPALCGNLLPMKFQFKHKPITSIQKSF